MVYGHYITDTVGNEYFFVEGCSYCQMSTGGLHEGNCPMRDIKIAPKPSAEKIPSHSTDKVAGDAIEPIRR